MHSMLWPSVWLRLLPAGIVLVPVLAFSILTSLLGWGNSVLRTWASRSTFCAGTLWMGLFLLGFRWLATGGGIGVERKSLILVGAVSILSAALGALTFHSWWRLLGLVPVAITAYFLIPLDG